jgi:hypothetical protein
MNYHTYENAAVYLNDYFILAKDVTVTSSSSIVSQYRIKSRYMDSEYVPTNGLVHSISMSYYPMGYDAVYALVNGDSPALFKLGDATFSAYLINFSISATYAQPILAQASFECWADYEGELGDERIKAAELALLEAESKIKIPHSLTTQVTNNLNVEIPVSFNFSHSCEFSPIYRIDSPNLSEVRYGKRKKTCSLDGENIGRFISVYGENGIVSIKLQDLCRGDLDQFIYKYYSNYDIDEDMRNTTYSIDGKITRFEFRVNDSPIVMGGISIEQDI